MDLSFLQMTDLDETEIRSVCCTPKHSHAVWNLETNPFRGGFECNYHVCR
jgi:hypothetical protein